MKKKSPPSYTEVIILEKKLDRVYAKRKAMADRINAIAAQQKRCGWVPSELSIEAMALHAKLRRIDPWVDKALNVYSKACKAYNKAMVM